MTAAYSPTASGELHSRTARFEAVGVIVAGVGFAALAGLSGVLVAVTVAVTGYLLPATYAFAVGQIALVAFVPGGQLALVALAEVGLFGVLLAPTVTLADPLPSIAITAGWALVGGVLAWVSASTVLDAWVAGLLLLAVTTLVAYALHRYQVVSLGLVGDGDSRGGDLDGQ